MAADAPVSEYIDASEFPDDKVVPVLHSITRRWVSLVEIEAWEFEAVTGRVVAWGVPPRWVDATAEELAVHTDSLEFDDEDGRHRRFVGLHITVEEAYRRARSAQRRLARFRLRMLRRRWGRCRPVPRVSRARPALRVRRRRYRVSSRATRGSPARPDDPEPPQLAAAAKTVALFRDWFCTARVLADAYGLVASKVWERVEREAAEAVREYVTVSSDDALEVVPIEQFRRDVERWRAGCEGFGS